jgi:hypothetical protein
MILDLYVKYHQEINTSKYLLSLDNWYFIMWYIYILIIFTLAITFNYLISCQGMYLFLIPIVFLGSCDSIWFCWTCFVLFLM